MTESIVSDVYIESNIRLQYLIDEYFKPRGYELNGRVNYRGERFEDIGMIYIKENNIQQICRRYDMNKKELIIAVTMDTNKKWCMKYGNAEIH